MAITGSEAHSTATNTAKIYPPMDVLSVKCDSCGFTEECTPAYILRVREKYQGRWICGLCVEAVKDEVIRSDMRISTEEALNRHITFYKKFRSSSSLKEAEYPISAISRLFRRSLDSPGPLRSSSSSDLSPVDGVRSSGLVRSESCFPSLSR